MRCSAKHTNHPNLSNHNNKSMEMDLEMIDSIDT